MNKTIKFEEGQEVFLDGRPYRLTKTKITRVTKTLIRVECDDRTFDHRGHLRGANGSNYFRPSLSPPTPDLEKAYLTMQTRTALMVLTNAVSLLSDDDCRALVAMHDRVACRGGA